ncbi:hypothetical protein AVEN_131196-1 [Araneus ventricosus]|uniref:Uncharacterized protein n=1 Tax=Araneus ventricosus TaxID=182803 RepID=A0A4Y2CS14_ARAVE|nr:hypothetical protein AVEN_77595-1 [Araneus ventricosus]GBM06597.1 hypothetical protein AVEN_131196-1 [Araneus ventricosus]
MPNNRSQQEKLLTKQIELLKFKCASEIPKKKPFWPRSPLKIEQHWSENKHTTASLLPQQAKSPGLDPDMKYHAGVQNGHELCDLVC